MCSLRYAEVYRYAEVIIANSTITGPRRRCKAASEPQLPTHTVGSDDLPDLTVIRMSWTRRLHAAAPTREKAPRVPGLPPLAVRIGIPRVGTTVVKARLPTQDHDSAHQVIVLTSPTLRTQIPTSSNGSASPRRMRRPWDSLREVHETVSKQSMLAELCGRTNGRAEQPRH